MKYNKILIIDNDWDDIEIFRQAVMEVSPAIRCTFTQDAVRALDELQEGVIFPKAIFLDMEMGLMNGQEFLQRVKADNKIKGIPIFILSTHSDPAIKAKAIEAGAADFITKPSSFKDLVSVLKRILM
jgi:CheY-like chemotaxis protein